MNKLNKNDLINLRQIGDSHADDFVNQVISKHELTELNTFFKKLIYNQQVENDNIPADFSEYIKTNSKLPPWADYSKIKLAQEVFTRTGPAFVIAYFCKSLPECYACGKGAEILFKTGRLSKHTRRRIAQTAQFVLDVMSPGGLEAGGRGIATALKVRIMHASIRYYFINEVNKGNIDYDVNNMGLPINQEDLLGTMLAFSSVVIQGMEKLGDKFTTEEKEAILHLWKCTGYLIGIEEKYMPETYPDAGEVWEMIKEGNFESTRYGIELNNELIALLDEILHQPVLDDVITIMMHHLLDKDAIKILKVRTLKRFNLLAIVAYILGLSFLKFESRGFFGKLASRYVNLKLLYGLEKYIAEGEDTGIYIPPSLREDWKVENPLMSLFNMRN
ncbi:MAG: DUF2236 domain-containing protein [Candidatus Kapabacteria bacterium]|nr:DUF2236 domain-containing protein [Ignavibacteriota bacterium]MCW5886448.1 DUF2236 domain-containing protein [Candidatus Kapabacteria bacterium]